MFAPINKKQGLCLAPDFQIYGAPEGKVDPTHTFLFFQTKEAASRTALRMIAPKFKVIEVE